MYEMVANKDINNNTLLLKALAFYPENVILIKDDKISEINEIYAQEVNSIFNIFNPRFNCESGAGVEDLFWLCVYRVRQKKLLKLKTYITSQNFIDKYDIKETSVFTYENMFNRYINGYSDQISTFKRDKIQEYKILKTGKDISYSMQEMIKEAVMAR